MTPEGVRQMKQAAIVRFYNDAEFYRRVLLVRKALQDSVAMSTEQVAWVLMLDDETRIALAEIQALPG